MPLSLLSRRIGDVTLVKCRGRIVEGDEASSLTEHLTGRLPDGPYFVLDLSDVDFIDSAGLGLLALWLTRLHATDGRLTLCAVPAHIVEVLRVTRLQTVFESYVSEAEAVAACYRSARLPDAPYRFTTDILCVASSDEVLTYLRQVLGRAGYGVVTASNVPDALVLLKATQPRTVVVGAVGRADSRTPITIALREFAGARAVLELPADFSTRDAGEAGMQLLDRVRALAGKPAR